MTLIPSLSKCATETMVTPIGPKRIREELEPRERTNYYPTSGSCAGFFPPQTLRYKTRSAKQSEVRFSALLTGEEGAEPELKGLKPYYRARFTTSSATSIAGKGECKSVKVPL